MNEIVVKLLELEKEYGTEIFSEKGRLLALIKDYFPEKKREQRILEKGLELKIYSRISNATPKEILFYRTQLLQELVDEHGLNDVAAENTVQIWIRLIELKRGVQIQLPKSQETESADIKEHLELNNVLGKAINVYKKLVHRDSDKKRIADVYSKTVQDKEANWDKDSATYEKSDEIHFDDKQGVCYEEEEVISEKAYREREKIKNSLETQTYSLDKSKKKEPRGGAKDVFDVLIKGASKNDAAAQNVLGKFYFNGTMTERNTKEAFKWFEKAANLGEPQAQNNLAYCYFQGEGVQKNLQMAITWFTKSARQGNLSAIVSLANCYYDGVGVERNVSEALSWYLQSAEKGDATSQFIIGECYYKGEAVSKSKVEAIKWYEKAAAQNHSYAKERLEELKYLKQMTDARRRANTPVVSNNTDWYAKRFINNLITTQPIDEDILNHLEIHSDKNDLLPKILNKVSGLGLKFENTEYPICIFTAPASVQKFSDKIILSTLGIHIIRVMKKPRFLYYADVTTLDCEEETGKININDYSVSCHITSAAALQSLIKIIRDLIKEFK